MKAFTVLRRVAASVCRIALLLLIIMLVVWAFGIRMPGRNPSKAAALNNTEIALRGELVADVQTLAGDIGERNLKRYEQIITATEFIESSMNRAGLAPRRDSYE